MRTTITLDKDVDAFLGRYRAESHLSFKEAVNELLRRGIASMKSVAATPKKPVLIRTFSVGKILDTSDCPSNLLIQQDNEGTL